MTKGVEMGELTFPSVNTQFSFKGCPTAVGRSLLGIIRLGAQSASSLARFFACSASLAFPTASDRRLLLFWQLRWW